MAMSHHDWQLVKAKIDEMENAVKGLKAMREQKLALPDSVLRAMDEAIASSEQRIAELKKAMAN